MPWMIVPLRRCATDRLRRREPNRRRHAEPADFDNARMPATLYAIDPDARNALRARFPNRWLRSGVGLAGHGRFPRAGFDTLT